MGVINEAKKTHQNGFVTERPQIRSRNLTNNSVKRGSTLSNQMFSSH